MAVGLLILMVINVLGCLQDQRLQSHSKYLMHQKLENMLLGRVNKLITKIAEDGIRQGIMHTDYPAEAVEMTMTYSYTAFDSMVQYSEEEKQKKVTGFIYNTERLFGMESGALFEAMKPIFEK